MIAFDKELAKTNSARARRGVCKQHRDPKLLQKYNEYTQHIEMVSLRRLKLSNPFNR
jgi:hypothetical protein